MLEGTKQSKAEDDLGGGGEGWYFLESIDNRIQINSISFKIQLILEGNLYFVWSSFRFNRNEFQKKKKKKGLTALFFKIMLCTIHYPRVMDINPSHLIEAANLRDFIPF